MSYSIIQPPFTLKFDEMTKERLKAYAKWFHDVAPQRISTLSRAVKATEGFEDWDPDLTVNSLAVLGDWFAAQVETREKTKGEIDETNARLSFQIQVPGEDLTNRTFSLAMDIGMYFAQVVLRNLPGTSWDQPLQDKRFADFGQPVLVGFGAVPLNPVRIVVTMAYAVARNKQSGQRLRELYDVWAGMRKP